MTCEMGIRKKPIKLDTVTSGSMYEHACTHICISQARLLPPFPTATHTRNTHASQMHLSPSLPLSPSLMQTNMHLAHTHTHRQVFSNHVRQPDRKRREGTADVMHTAASHAPLSMVLPNSHLPKVCVCVCVCARARACLTAFLSSAVHVCI